jgi:hypothetical protein
MSGTGESRVDFAGEERAFRIRLGEIRRIEKACGTPTQPCGIGEVLRRLSRCVSAVEQIGGLGALSAGVEIRADDVRESIYQGLRGAGMTDGEATTLVRREIDDRGVKGLLDHASTALVVLWAATKVPEQDAPGEQTAGENPATPPSPSTSDTSTGSEPQ